MEEAPENGKESSHSAHANGMYNVLYTPEYIPVKAKIING
jgi:hypothetical protein